MAEQWYAVIDEATGEARSFGTVLADVLPDGLVAVPIAKQPNRAQRWNAAKRAIEAVAPAPDRVTEFTADPTVAAIVSKLTAGERAALLEKLRGKFG